MSPFSQLGSALGGLSSGIDHEFNSAIRHLDQFDRHFSHSHRFMNCFIPRFDLEEDAKFYYVYGELPGAKEEDITIEAHGQNTLVVYGRTHRPVTLSQQTSEHHSEKSDTSENYVKVPHRENQNKGVPPSADGSTYITADVSDAGKPIPGQHFPATPNGTYPEIDRRDPSPPASRQANFINIDVSDAGKPSPRHHHPHHSVEHDPIAEAANKIPEHRTLLSERLVGDFHRNFTFPCPISEEGVKASMESGLLTLLVPKVEGKARGRKIHIGQNQVPGGVGLRFPGSLGGH
jgi:HSP20 family protein